MHTHSSHSCDCLFSPKTMVEAAYKKGTDGIALTDHNSIDGWTEAEQACKEMGMFFIRGEEIYLTENNKIIGEVLAYFIHSHIDYKNKTVEQIVKEIKGQGGIAILAHPYHARKPFKDIDKYLHLFDGIEIYNSRLRSQKRIDKTVALVKKYDVSYTAGSDAHSPFGIGNGYLESPATNLEDFRKDILNKNTKWGGKLTPFYIKIFAVIGSIKRLVG